MGCGCNIFIKRENNNEMNNENILNIEIIIMMLFPLLYFLQLIIMMLNINIE